jgi:hypothetical protein
MYYYQHFPTRFGAYCAIFRENLIVGSDPMLLWLVTGLKLHYTRIYKFTDSHSKTHIWFNVKLIMAKNLCKTSYVGLRKTANCYLLQVLWQLTLLGTVRTVLVYYRYTSITTRNMRGMENCDWSVSWWSVWHGDRHKNALGMFVCYVSEQRTCNSVCCILKPQI